MNKLVVMFPGSGSQYKGMMKRLYDTESCVKRIFDEADNIIGKAFSKVVMEGSIIDLNKIENMLPGIYVSSIAMYELFHKETGGQPDLYLGHSLGEYAALASAGIMSFEEGLRAVLLRSRIAREVLHKTGGGMTILKGITPQEADLVCQNLREQEGCRISIACYNTKNQVSLAGLDEDLCKAEKMVRSSCPGAQIINLIGSAPYHSELMKDKVQEFYEMLMCCHFKKVSKAVVSNVNALPYESEEDIINGLTRQLYQPVLWEQSLSYAAKQGARLFIEIGPLNVLKNIFLDSGLNGDCYTYDEMADRNMVKHVLNKKQSDTSEDYGEIVLNCLLHARSLRNYQQDSRKDIFEAKLLYQEIILLKQKSDLGEVIIDEEAAKKALDMLVVFFDIKNTAKKERQERIVQIGKVTGKSAFCEKWIEREKSGQK